jgi:MyTH4 domain
VQAMKQLTDNPISASEQRCWEVLMLLIATFPPPQEVENYVHAFVRARAPAAQRDALKLAVHMSVAEGPKASAPAEKDIPGLLSAFFSREIAPRYNIDEDVVSAAAPVAPPRQVRFLLLIALIYHCCNSCANAKICTGSGIAS